jgi:hypothetical protein
MPNNPFLEEYQGTINYWPTVDEPSVEEELIKYRGIHKPNPYKPQVPVRQRRINRLMNMLATPENPNHSLPPEISGIVANQIFPQLPRLDVKNPPRVSGKMFIEDLLAEENAEDYYNAGRAEHYKRLWPNDTSSTKDTRFEDKFLQETKRIEQQAPNQRRMGNYHYPFRTSLGSGGFFYPYGNYGQYDY